MAKRHSSCQESVPYEFPLMNNSRLTCEHQVQSIPWVKAAKMAVTSADLLYNT